MRRRRHRRHDEYELVEVVEAAGARTIPAQVDMFPQTRHIEAMALFIRDAHGRSRGCA